jgi:hypothetical protein
MQITHIKSNTLADKTGTVTFWDGSSTGSVAATNQIRPSDWNSQHALQFTLAGNTTGNSTVSGTNVIFNGAGGISIGGSNGSLMISGPAGGGGVTLTAWRPFELGNNTTFSSLGVSTLYLQHFIPDENVAFSNIEFWGRGSFVSSSNNNSNVGTIRYGLYSQETGASSTRMTLAGSSSIVYTSAYSSSTSAGATWSGNGSSYTTGGANTSVLTQLSGPNHYYFPFVSTISANVKYALGLQHSTAGVTNGGQWQPLHMSMMNSRSFGAVKVNGVTGPNVSRVGDRELATYGTTSGGLHASYATSQLGIAISRMVWFVQFED